MKIRNVIQQKEFKNGFSFRKRKSVKIVEEEIDGKVYVYEGEKVFVQLISVYSLSTPHNNPPPQFKPPLTIVTNIGEKPLSTFPKFTEYFCQSIVSNVAYK